MLKTLSKREKKLIFILINLSLLMLFYFIISLNIYRINENKIKIISLEQQIDVRSGDIANDSQVLSQIREYEIRNEESRQYLFPLVNNQHLHMYIDDFLSYYNLSTVNIDILKVEEIEEVGTIVDLVANVRGDINDFYNFLLAVESQNKFISVDALDIVTVTDGSPNIFFTLRFYMTQDGNSSNFNFNF